MALKIVTGGTTGAADGTLVSSGNPLVIVALNTAVNAHIRCDDGYWSADQSFDVPAELEVSFDGGSTWYDNADEPITAPEIYAVNVPIKIRQTVAAGSTSGSFVTDGTYTAIAALSTPTLTCTVASSTQIDLSWTNVSNEDASPGYTLDRSTAADFSANLVTVTKDANVTTHSATGLTTGTRYYFRVRAEGSGRYSDSGYGTDDDTPAATVGTFYSVAGGDGVVQKSGAVWATQRGAATGDSRDKTSAFGSCMQVQEYTGTYYIDRGFLSFDTSSIPDGATITDAVLYVYVHGKSDVGIGDSLVLVEGTQASATDLSTADYDAFGATELASRVALTAITAGAYKAITLNSSGRGVINKTGHTQLCTRSARDVDDSAPGAGKYSSVAIYWSDETGTSKDPYLQVTYY